MEREGARCALAIVLSDNNALELTGGKRDRASRLARGFRRSTVLERDLLDLRKKPVVREKSSIQKIIDIHTCVYGP